MYMFMRAAPDTSTIAVRYEAGYVVLSYFISLAGCITTLELLQRRTSSRSAYNWYLLTASSITMGGVGIWCMHFIGSRAVVLDNGAVNLQLLYDAGYTALSFFLPIMVLFVAFYLLAIRPKPTGIYILATGTLTGIAVCAMHYLGQVGISNYYCTYQAGNIVGAAAIAVIASLIALNLFFRLHETWTDTWWKKALCAALLATAVSGMHWTATMGTLYRYRLNGPVKGSATREQSAVVCTILSIATCVLLFGISLLARRRTLLHQKRAQELVLACAYFDEEDRVMVTRDGTLPYEKITNHFVKKTFGDDEFNRSHPAFLWVYRASRNWAILRELLSGMQNYLSSDPVARRYQPDHESSTDLPSTVSTEFNTIFKQLFCVAAQRLAQQMHKPIDQLGVLFEEPLETGTLKSSQSSYSLHPLWKYFSQTCQCGIEVGKRPQPFGKGRCLFLSRRLTKTEAADFAALGYRFGSILHVGESLARNMQVSHEEMLVRLGGMKIWASKKHLHPSRVHLACFMVRPSVSTGFDVLVPAVSQCQLPLVTLPIAEILPLHQRVLQEFDERTIREVLQTLVAETVETNPDQAFRWQLHSTLVKLVDLIGDLETMMEARLSAKPVQARTGTASPSPCLLLPVRILGTIHSASPRKELTYLPLDFFSAQQTVEICGTNNLEFKRKTDLEFAHCLDRTPGPVTKATSSHSANDDIPRTSRKPPERVTDSALELDRVPPSSLIQRKPAATFEIQSKPESDDHAGNGAQPRPFSLARSVGGDGDGDGDVDDGEDHESFVAELFALFQLGRGRVSTIVCAG